MESGFDGEVDVVLFYDEFQAFKTDMLHEKAKAEEHRAEMNNRMEQMFLIVQELRGTFLPHRPIQSWIEFCDSLRPQISRTLKDDDAQSPPVTVCNDDVQSPPVTVCDDDVQSPPVTISDDGVQSPMIEVNVSVFESQCLAESVTDKALGSVIVNHNTRLMNTDIPVSEGKDTSFELNFVEQSSILEQFTYLEKFDLVMLSLKIKRLNRRNWEISRAPFVDWQDFREKLARDLTDEGLKSDLQGGLKPPIHVSLKMSKPIMLKEVNFVLLEMLIHHMRDGVIAAKAELQIIEASSAVLRNVLMAKQFDMAHRLFEEMLHRALASDKYTYSTFIVAFGKVNMFDSALTRLQKMEQNRVSVNQKFLEALSVFAEMKEGNFPLDLTTCDIVIDVSGQLDMVKEVDRMIGSLGRMDIEPNVVSHNTLLRVYGEAELFGEAIHFFKLMQRKGSEQNVVIYNKMIKIYGKTMEHEKAINLVQERHHRGIDPKQIAVRFWQLRCVKQLFTRLAKDILLEVEDSAYSQFRMSSAGNELVLVPREPTRSAINGHSNGSNFSLFERNVSEDDVSSNTFEKGEKRSLGGLQNLGNTCLMNITLLCLTHTPFIIEHFLQNYKIEINAENPLGMRGEHVVAFGEFVRRLWTSGQTTVVPCAFKTKLARIALQSSGYNQHDSQDTSSVESCGGLANEIDESFLSDENFDEVMAAPSSTVQWLRSEMMEQILTISFCFPGVTKEELVKEKSLWGSSRFSSPSVSPSPSLSPSQPLSKLVTDNTHGCVSHSQHYSDETEPVVTNAGEVETVTEEPRTMAQASGAVIEIGSVVHVYDLSIHLSCMTIMMKQVGY